MNVEQENRREAIFLSFQRRRIASGTNRVIVRAKSAFTTVASAAYSPRDVFTAVIRRPAKASDSTGSS